MPETDYPAGVKSTGKISKVGWQVTSSPLLFQRDEVGYAIRGILNCDWFHFCFTLNVKFGIKNQKKFSLCCPKSLSLSTRQMTEVRGQMSEDRSQRTDNKGQEGEKLGR